MSKALTRIIDGWSVTMDGDEPRVLDEELGIRLGFARPRGIRKLIKRMMKQGALSESDVRTTRTAGGQGRPGAKYHLTAGAAQLVSARSRAKPRIDDLYILESSCGWFKIGRSVDVSARIRGIEWQCPPSVTLELIAVVPGGGDRERTLHEAFYEYRERGEWFSPRASTAIRTAIAGGLEDFIQQTESRHDRQRSKQPVTAHDTNRLARVLAVRRATGERLRRQQTKSLAPSRRLSAPRNPVQTELAIP